MTGRLQRGVVLVVVLWVIALLTVLLAAFTVSVKTDRQGVAGVVSSVEARAAMDSVLNYLAAMNGVGAPELEEMAGQRYELKLGDQEVSFRVYPETAFIPLNGLELVDLIAVLDALQVENPEEQAAWLVELRSGGIDEETGERRAPVQIRSMDHLAQLVGMDGGALSEYGGWFSFVGQHQRLTPGYVPEQWLDVLAHLVSEPENGEEHVVWQPGAATR